MKIKIILNISSSPHRIHLVYTNRINSDEDIRPIQVFENVSLDQHNSTIIPNKLLQFLNQDIPSLFSNFRLSLLENNYIILKCPIHSKWKRYVFETEQIHKVPDCWNDSDHHCIRRNDVADLFIIRQTTINDRGIYICQKRVESNSVVELTKSYRLRFSLVKLKETLSDDKRDQWKNLIIESIIDNIATTTGILYLVAVSLPVFSVSNLPKLLYVSYQSTIFLNCPASGFPIPSIQWYHNRREVDESWDRFVFDGYRLKKNNATLDDNGFYTCVIKNRYGYSTHTTYVRIRTKPKVINSLIINRICSDKYMVNWQFNGSENEEPLKHFFVRLTTKTNEINRTINIKPSYRHIVIICNETIQLICITPVNVLGRGVEYCARYNNSTTIPLLSLTPHMPHVNKEKVYGLFMIRTESFIYKVLILILLSLFIFCIAIGWRKRFRQ
ncbi:hypothetical protein SNEBB_011325 [Seison nebaliae]|nr:hypothetical protein SNEBB_011325 [Seison nebaliae]